MPHAGREVAFELERFEWAEGRLEVAGRWKGLGGRRLGRPVLTVTAGLRRRRLYAEREGTGTTEDGWRAAFAWDGDPGSITAAELEVGRNLVVVLPLPDLRRRRRRGASGDAPTREALLQAEVSALREEVGRLRTAAEASEAGLPAETVAGRTRRRDEPDAAAAEAVDAPEADASADADAKPARKGGRKRSPSTHAEPPAAAAAAGAGASATADDAAARLAALEAERDEAAARLSALEAERDEAAARAAALESERDEAAARAAALESERDEAQSRVEVDVSERDQAAARVVALGRERDDAFATLASLEREHDATVARLRAEIDNLHQGFADAADEAEEQRESLRRLQDELTRARRRAERAEERLVDEPLGEEGRAAAEAEQPHAAPMMPPEPVAQTHVPMFLLTGEEPGMAASAPAAPERSAPRRQGRDGDDVRARGRRADEADEPAAGEVVERADRDRPDAAPRGDREARDADRGALVDEERVGEDAEPTEAANVGAQDPTPRAATESGDTAAPEPTTRPDRPDADSEAGDTAVAEPTTRPDRPEADSETHDTAATEPTTRPDRSAADSEAGDTAVAAPSTSSDRPGDDSETGDTAVAEPTTPPDRPEDDSAEDDDVRPPTRSGRRGRDAAATGRRRWGVPFDREAPDRAEADAREDDDTGPKGPRGRGARATARGNGDVAPRGLDDAGGGGAAPRARRIDADPDARAERPSRLRDRSDTAAAGAETGEGETEGVLSRVTTLLRPSGEDGSAGLGERVGRWLSSVTDRSTGEDEAPPGPVAPPRARRFGGAAERERPAAEALPRPRRSAAPARRRAELTAARRRSDPALWAVRILALVAVVMMLVAFALLVGALA